MELIAVTLFILIIGVVTLEKIGVFKNTFTKGEDKDQKLPYKKKDYLLSIAERKFYDVLSKVAEENNFLLFAKVRLEDLLWLPKGTENRFGLRNRIKSRHIDFVLCDKQNIKPLLAIELDDSSHDTERGRVRDINIDHILKDAELPILHVRAVGFYNKVDLANRIKEFPVG
ncbi:MAG: DUF2726 domain-containing protein [Patescibacteria group bacterium]